MKPQKIELSYKTIVFTVIFLLSLLLLWSIRGILLLLFVCFIFAEALNPTVNRLVKAKIPRPLAIIIIYLIILAIFSFAIAGIIPGLVDQTSGLIDTLPRTISSIKIFGITADQIYPQFRLLETLPTNIATLTVSLFSDIFSGFIVLVVTFYLILEKKNFSKYALGLFGVKGQEKTEKIMLELETKMGSWVNAELFLMTVIGVLSYFGYIILGLNYALPLAIIAGLLEIVPSIGPTIATILAAIVGLSISPLTALLAIIWGIIIQQLEGNIIVPKVMRDNVGLKPLITIVLIAAGAKLAGVLGAILAVPTFLTLEVIIKNIINKK